MNTKIKFNLLIICLSLFAIASKKNTNQITGDKFEVVNADETMPVWVHGKSNSKFIILAVHGGPGSDVLDFRNYKGGLGFRGIEEKYLVAYWQQRASGLSKGPDDPKYFTIEQYVSDLDKVINEIKKRYPGKPIILFGHSWGGMLTSAYLKEAIHRNKLKAWIDADGLQSATEFSKTSLDDLNKEINYRLSINQNVENWTKVKSLLAQNPDLGTINATAYNVLDIIPEVKTKVNMSDFNFTNRAGLSNGVLFKQIIETNNNPYLKNIQLPTLILWGKYDFAVSKTLRAQTIENLPKGRVTSVEFPESGHYIMFHQPKLFASSIINFVNKL